MPTFHTPAPITAILDVPAGRVRVVAAERADTSVEARPADPAKARDVQAAERTAVELRAGVLRVATPARRGALGPTGAVEVTVHLPAGSHVEATVAATEVRGVGRLGDVTVRTDAGDVVVDEATSARIATQAGDVTVARLGGDAQITTAKGGITVTEARGGSLTLRAQAGDVTVGVAPGVSASLGAGTGYGRISNALVSTGAAALRIHATTAYGDITARSL
jgi:hypothetical protein